MKRWHRRLVVGGAILTLVFLAWFWFLPNGGHPRTVGQSVDRLLDTLPSEVLDDIAASEEDELIKYHMSLGMHIRNEHGLWGGNFRLVISTGRLSALHGDYASGCIIHALWKELRKTSSQSNENEAANKSVMPGANRAAGSLRSGGIDPALAYL